MSTTTKQICDQCNVKLTYIQQVSSKPDKYQYDCKNCNYTIILTVPNKDTPQLESSLGVG